MIKIDEKKIKQELINFGLLKKETLTTRMLYEMIESSSLSSCINLTAEIREDGQSADIIEIYYRSETIDKYITLVMDKIFNIVTTDKILFDNVFDYIIKLEKEIIDTEKLMN